MATCSTPLRLDCPVCKKKMTKPTAFQCLHFFCQPCVDDMKPASDESKTGYKCPICRELTPIEQSDTMDYVPKLFSTNEKETENKLCDKCKTETPIQRCLDCKENLCTDCQGNHNSWSILKHHKWEDLDGKDQDVIDQIVFCSEHPENPVKLHCKDCQLTVCMFCINKSHKDHATETFGNALAEILPQVTDKKDRVEQIITHNENTLSRAINHAEDLKKKYEDLERKIDEKCEEVIQKARADCKKAKDELATIKAKEMDNVEEFINDLEMRLKSGKNTVSLTEAALHRSKDASLLHGLQTNVTKRLTKSMEDRMSGKAIIRTIRADFEAKDVSADNCLGQIAEVLCKSRHINRNLMEIDEVTLIKTIETGKTHVRFAMIGDELWIPEWDTNKIHIYSFDGKFLRTYEIDNGKMIWSLAKLDKNVIVVSNKGLSMVDTNETIANKVLDGSFIDVFVLKDKLYALDYISRKMQIMKYHRGQVLAQTEFFINAYNKQEYYSIHVTPACIYISYNVSQIITKHSHTGDLIQTFGTAGSTEGIFNQPLLCGGDSDGNVLVANAAKTDKLQVLTYEGAPIDIQVPEIVQPVCAAVFGDTLFVLQLKGRLIKYSIKMA